MQGEVRSSDVGAAVGCTLLVVLAAWLRLRHLGLAEFNDDQAIALRIAHDILNGNMRTVGLASSSGAANPPLYVYIVALVVAIHHGLLFATASVAVASVAAIALTFVVVRRRFGTTVALTTAALFATAPWAVLYGRHLWQQDYLPLVTVSLLWSLFVVLERDRTRAAFFVPVLFAVAFQLNLSAVALIVPIAAVMAYRARTLDWRAVAVGSAVGVMSLGTWLAHLAKHPHDVVLIVTNGRGHHGGSVGGGAVEAVRQTIHLASAEGWTFETGPHHQGGVPWTIGRAAGLVVVALVVLGIAVSISGAVRHRRSPTIDVVRRAFLVVWLLGICLAYLPSARGGVGPHYLIVSYPVSFLLAALGLGDVVALAGHGSAVIALAVTGALAVALVSFTLSFQRFVARHGGAGGAYGVVYDDTAALAKAARARNLHIWDGGAEYLAWGHLTVPAGTRRAVAVRNRLRDHSFLVCSGRRRWFGPLETCWPT